jgi:hypothetical protein
MAAWRSKRLLQASALLAVFIAAFIIATLLNYITTRNLCR